MIAVAIILHTPIPHFLIHLKNFCAVQHLNNQFQTVILFHLYHSWSVVANLFWPLNKYVYFLLFFFRFIHLKCWYKITLFQLFTKRLSIKRENSQIIYIFKVFLMWEMNIKLATTNGAPWIGSEVAESE